MAETASESSASISVVPLISQTRDAVSASVFLTVTFSATPRFSAAAVVEAAVQPTMSVQTPPALRRRSRTCGLPTLESTSNEYHRPSALARTTRFAMRAAPTASFQTASACAM